MEAVYRRRCSRETHSKKWGRQLVRTGPCMLVFLAWFILYGNAHGQASSHRRKLRGLYTTGRELMSAVADPNGPLELELANDIRLVETDFPSAPIYINRNITFMGRPDHWMSFSMGRQNRKLQMLDNIVMTLQYVIISEFWDDAKSGMESEIMCPMLSNERAVVRTNYSAILNYVCLPPAYVQVMVSIDTRPEWVSNGSNYLEGTVPFHKIGESLEIPWPGAAAARNQTSPTSEITGDDEGAPAPSPPPPVPPTQPCINDPDAPILRRCWDNVAYFVDFASVARTYDDLRQMQYLNYVLHFVDTYVLCAHMVDEACIQQYTFVGCLGVRQKEMLALDEQKRQLRQQQQRQEQPEMSNISTPGSTNSTVSTADPSGSGGVSQTGRDNGDAGGGGGNDAGWSTGQKAGVGVAVGVGCLLIIAVIGVLVVRSRRQRLRVKYLPPGKAGPGTARAPGCPSPGSSGSGEFPDSSGEHAIKAMEEGAGAGPGDNAAAGPRVTAAASKGSPNGSDHGQVRKLAGPDAANNNNEDARGPSHDGDPAPAGPVATMMATAGDLRQPDVVVSPFTPLRSNLELRPDVAQVVKLLPVVRGKGAFGKVYEGLYGGEKVAVKVMVRDMFDVLPAPAVAMEGEAALAAAVNAGNSHLRSFAMEVEVLGRCQHPNVVRLLAACLTPPRYCLVMELMETSLQRLVFGSGSGELLPLPKVLHIATEVASGLEYLHPTIVHRDLKPDNILINGVDSPRPAVKVSDFGLSRLRSTVVATKSPGAGTPSYMAPECFDVMVKQITHHVDMYSWGVVVWALLTGVQPWAGLAVVEIAYRVTLVGERLPPVNAVVPGRCPRRLQRLLEQCWSREPSRRPAAAEAVKQMLLIAQQPNDAADDADAAASAVAQTSANDAPDDNCLALYADAALRAAKYAEAAAAAHTAAVVAAAAAGHTMPKPPGGHALGAGANEGADADAADALAIPQPPTGEDVPEGTAWKPLGQTDADGVPGLEAGRPGLMAVGLGEAFPAALKEAGGEGEEERQARGHVYRLVQGENGTTIMTLTAGTATNATPDAGGAAVLTGTDTHAGTPGSAGTDITSSKLGDTDTRTSEIRPEAAAAGNSGAIASAGPGAVAVGAGPGAGAGARPVCMIQVGSTSAGDAAAAAVAGAGDWPKTGTGGGDGSTEDDQVGLDGAEIPVRPPGAAAAAVVMGLPTVAVGMQGGAFAVAQALGGPGQRGGEPRAPGHIFRAVQGENGTFIMSTGSQSLANTTLSGA